MHYQVILYCRKKVMTVELPDTSLSGCSELDGVGAVRINKESTKYLPSPQPPRL